MTVDDARQMRELITFQFRPDTGYPGEFGDWTDQFTLSARLKPRLLGGESVTAARMTGKQPYVMTIRGDSRSRRITGAWRCFDARRRSRGLPDRWFAILSIADVAEDNAWLDLLVQEGMTP
jgi:hypothetical protein